MVAAEVQARDAHHRAWVGVYPPRSSRNTFVVRYFEVDREVMAAEHDIHEEQLEHQEKFFVREESDLVQLLSRWLTNLDALQYPSFVDYPI